MALRPSRRKNRAAIVALALAEPQLVARGGVQARGGLECRRVGQQDAHLGTLAPYSVDRDESWPAASGSGQCAGGLLGGHAELPAQPGVDLFQPGLQAGVDRRIVSSS